MLEAPRRVVLVGNPNTGKSTLFGALSGMSVRTGNYAGVTIEKKVGRISDAGIPIELVDLPGTYSLSPRSPDELVAVEVLTGDAVGEPTPDLLVCVVNATLLRRNLFLVSQLLELGRPLLIALNMMDAAKARDLSIDCERLSRNLGVPVNPISASRREGIESLRQQIVTALTQTRHIEPLQSLPQSFYTTRERLAAALTTLAPTRGLPNAYLLERAILDTGGEAEKWLMRRFGGEAKPAIESARGELLLKSGEPSDMECESRYEWCRAMLEGVIGSAGDFSHRATDRLDSILTHRVFGLLIFAAMMMLIFQCIYAWSGIPMSAIETAQGTIAQWVEAAMPPGILRSLIIDGMIAGVGGVLIFLPQIAFLFLFLAILEDCGYMARAAFLVDRVMTMFGLSGKSFLPLMSSFACAVPGVMATRVIENPRDRLVTIFVAPFMSCSARLPVYLLLITAFVPTTYVLGGWVSLSGLVLLAMYLVGVFVAIPTAWLLKKTLLRGESAPLVLELPEYQWPDWRVIGMRVYQACKAFVIRAGTLIFAASILIWAAGYLPGDHSRQHELQALVESAPDSDAAQVAQWNQQLQVESARLLETSFLGRMGHAIEPAVKPLGWDWRIGIGAIASFPAREVIIATLGTVYSLGGEVDEEDTGLIEALRSSTWPDGRPVYNVPVALSIMVFFALCAQCVSTLLVMKRETNSWRWPVISFVYMTTLAYFGAMLTYQIGIRL
ncbi:MAG: ferrous iron transport protein B [Planctomycetaceae bacterium]